VVVGAYGEASNATGVNGTQSDNSAAYSGAAYVFVRSSGTWSQQAYLKASNPEATDWFGRSAAISGYTVVVGAYGEDSNATGVNGTQSANSAYLSGAPYVFQFGVSLAPASDTSAAGGVIGATVLVNAESWLPSWTAVSNVAWLSITGGASGTGNGTVTYTVAANRGSARTGTLTIGSQTFTVTQSAFAAQATLMAVASASTIAYNGTTTLSSTGGSGTGAVSYALATGGTSCGLAGTTVTGRTPGACTVVATKAGDGNYLQVRSAPITITVNKATQATLTTVAAKTGITYGQTTALTTTGGNGTGTVSYVVATGGSSCSITGSTLAATAAGSCTVVATKATDTNYTQASSTAITITVGKATQTALTTPVATPSTVAYGATATLSTSGGSGTGAVTYSVATGGANCSISGTKLTVTAVGNCTVVASKAADSNYNAATSSARTVYVTKATQATLTAVAAAATIARNGTTTLATTGGSGTGTVIYAVTAGGANCTLSGTTLTGKAVGTCTVTATKAGDSNYNAASAGVTITVQ
jgi:trimeric autotransporter adhesin